MKITPPNITPGTWAPENLAANGEQEIGIRRSHEQGGHSVCSVDSSRDSRRLLADARAISATPDTLAALASLVRESGRLPHELDLELSGHAPLIAAFAALIKAGYTIEE